MASTSLLAYDKPWQSIAEQVRLLQSRGLTITDIGQAEKFLRHINYFRFSGYCLAFEVNRHHFLAGTTFEEVCEAYAFDVALRDLFSEALEVIEVDVRATIALMFGQKYGAFGHTIQKNFRKTFRFDMWTEKLHEESNGSSELFVEHFQATYQGFPNLPCWMATELMSFGMVSKMYAGLLDQIQSPIAMRYNMQKGDLESTLRHLSYVRNLCAHHCRIWDRQFSVEPRLPHGTNWQPPVVPDKKRAFVSILMIYLLIKRCPLHSRYAVEWRKRVNELMKSLPKAQNALGRMGMPENWYAHPLWT